MTNTTRNNKTVAKRIRRIFGFGLVYALLLILREPSPSSARKVQTRKERRGDWVITEEFDRNNFVLDFVPEGPTITVTDTHPDTEITAVISYNGSVYLNAWASDEDFDVAPRYVESYTGIKYASTYLRFDRAEQAYGYNYVNFNVSTEDGKTREIFVNATKFGPMCIQDGVEEKYMNEDCLYLNIWRPSRWKQSLNTTSLCKQKFLGGGIFRKDCEIITTKRTIEADGRIVITTNTEKTSKKISMGGMYDRDGSLFDGNTDILDNKEVDKVVDEYEPDGGISGLNRLRGLQSISDTLDNAMDNLEDSLNDLNGVIEDQNSKDEEESNNNESTGGEDDEASTLGTYNVDSSGLLPVMVYIHGGEFFHGSGNDPLFDGSKAAGRGQVIIVTLNYRLGIYGFMPSFGWDQWKVNGGMNGFNDIVEAVIWIHRNIKQWGGNPDKITVFGPASTPAVCLLTMCPLAAGKFQRAILQTTIRETEVAQGRFVTQNGVNGASCLLSSQEPYQPLEGRIEIAYKFIDYINETYYNFPENPDPTREEIIDWLKAFYFNSTELWQVAKDEGTAFVPQRPWAEFDYNRDGNITDTQQRRTFMTWDNDIFPRMPIDLEYLNPIDMMVGVRGRLTDERKPMVSESPTSTPAEEDPGAVEEQSFHEDEPNSDNIFLRNSDHSHRYLEENERFNDANETDFGGNGTDFVEDDDDFDGVSVLESTGRKKGVDEYPLPDQYNTSICVNITELGDNQTLLDNETACEIWEFDFGGTTSDQDLCVTKQFLEIAARNVEGNVYGYIMDDGSDLHGYFDGRRVRRHLQQAHSTPHKDTPSNHPDVRVRRRLHEARQKHHENLYLNSPERKLGIRVRRMDPYDYDIETLYFFDNLYVGDIMGKDEVKVRREVFYRWINFAKTGSPQVLSRTDRESRKFERWDPIPTNKIGKDTNARLKYDEPYWPYFLHMSADPDGEFGQRKSRMARLDELVSHRTNRLFPHKYEDNNDICTWVLAEENDYDEDFVEVLLDFNANTAFEYYVTILATLNPTINYVPDREYIAKMPPTMAPTSIMEFVDNSIEMSAAPPPVLSLRRVTVTGRSGGLVSILFWTAVCVTVAGLFG